jgi:two-component system, sensor histidine kinase and response regulator
MSKLIVIDDDVVVRTNLIELFEMEGFEAIGAENGRVGVQLVRQHLPDLIVCDIVMPELDGYGVLEELQQDFATAIIPFIFLTAMADEKHLRQGMSLGAGDYLVKPFTRDVLLTAVSTRLARQTVFAQKTQTRLDDVRANIALALPQALRIPLTNILGFSELLSEGSSLLSARDIRDFAQSIYQAGKRLQDLTTNFLLYAELALAIRDPEFAATVKEPSPGDIGSTVSEVALEQAKQAHRAADLQLDLDQAVVSLGKVYLVKLTKELVNNAFKFSLPGQPVRIVGRREAPHAGQAMGIISSHQETGTISYQLTIEDHGLGMTSEQIANVGSFLQFESRLYEQQGQGLGLIIARWIAELHGGNLSIASVGGEGTRVRVSLPLFSTEPQTSLNSTSRSSLTNRILIIEDQAPIRANILELLDAEGYEVLGAENGRVGVQLARAYLPKVIVSDIIMPELDGYEVLEALRQDPTTATIPFIFLTAKADKTELRQGMNLGADDYLVKPFAQQELLKAIAVRLEKHSQVSAHFEEKVDELRNSITASLPHEFLTPLTIILTASEVLALRSEKLTVAERCEFGERIRASVQRLFRLIGNFLLYSQLDLAALDSTKAEVLRGQCQCDVRTTIADVAARLAQQADRISDLQLILRDATLQIEPSHLSKIVEELLDNAFRYSTPGTPVQVQCVTDDERVLILSVGDQGRGMTRAQIAQMGAYMQFDREHYEQQGQGLGLTIAKRLAELYGGELAIESVPGLNTTVRVVLPQ